MQGLVWPMAMKVCTLVGDRRRCAWGVALLLMSRRLDWGRRWEDAHQVQGRAASYCIAGVGN